MPAPTIAAASPTPYPRYTPAPVETPTPFPAPSAQAQADDRTALAALFDSANGAGWTDADNWLSDKPISEWSGISVDANGRVTALVLFRNALSGEIPPEIGGMSALKTLYLGDNILIGKIPSEIGDLTNLAELHLGDNDLSGKIPAEIGESGPRLGATRTQGRGSL